MSLTGKTVIVTGVASGIGKESAAELKRRGATVIGVDRNPADDVDEFFEADLSSRSSIDALVAALPRSVAWDDIKTFADKHNLGERGRSYFFSKEELGV